VLQPLPDFLLQLLGPLIVEHRRDPLSHSRRFRTR
jgi:hypothetical protein